MKRIDELLEAELVALDDDMIQRYIDYECALEGVPMLPPTPGLEPEKTFPGPDAKVYKIGEFMTRDSEHASRIMEALTSGQLVQADYDRDYNNKYLKALNPGEYSYPKIETAVYHSPEQWDRIKDDHSKFSVKKSEWENLKKTYDNALKERAGVTKKVFDLIQDARDRSYNRDRLRAEFARYLELAEDNRQIALNFLEKVKDLSEFPELRAEFLQKES